MNIKRIKITFLCFSISLLLSGCIDAMPDMTPEQQDLISEYAASLLLSKVDGYHSKIVEIPETETIEQTEETEKTESVEEESVEIEESETTQEEVKETSSEEIAQKTLTDVFQLDHTDIEYKGCEIVDCYPEDDSAFSISVSEGKKILVLKFAIHNLSDEEQNYDILKFSPKFLVNLNQVGYQRVMQTLLLDDFSTFQGTVEPGGEEQVVLTAQIADTEEVESVTLQTIINGEASETVLQ